MKKNFALLSALIFLSAAIPLSAKVVNRTIATVNGDPLLLSEFEKNWTAFIEQQKRTLPPDRLTDKWKSTAKKKIFEQMIDDELLLQDAKQKKIRVNQRDLESGIIQVKARFLPDQGKRQLERFVQRALAQQQGQPPAGGLDLTSAWRELEQVNPNAIKEAEKGFKDELRKEGLSNKKFEDRIRDQLSVVQLTSQHVRSQTQAPTDEEALDLFKKIKKIMDGKEVKGLDEEQQADLQSLANFFKTQTGERVRARHILIEVPKDASFKEKSSAKQELQKIRRKIDKGADFAEMAEEHSDDKASAVRGGDLGAFSKGQMVPPFEQAAFSLGVGEMADIVETGFGFHLIRVEEKRAASGLRYKAVENDLKEYLFRSNAQKTFETYVDNLREKASIKQNIELDELKLAD